MQIFLGYNYLSSEWYKKTYRIFNRDYSIELQTKIEKKKEGCNKQI